jgi:hypothetical protein
MDQDLLGPDLQELPSITAPPVKIRSKELPKAPFASFSRRVHPQPWSRIPVPAR